VSLETGHDNIEAGSHAFGTILAADDSDIVGRFPLNHGASWRNHTTHIVDTHLTAPVSIDQLKKLKIDWEAPADLFNRDDWKLNRVILYYKRTDGSWQKVLECDGNPVKNFHAARDSYVCEAVPPIPTIDIQRIRVTLDTGGDGIRDRAWLSFLDSTGGEVIPEFPSAGLSQGDRRNITRSYDSPLLTPLLTLTQLSKIKIRTNFSGGLGGDNWNIDRISIAYLPVGSTIWQPLREFSGEPVVRLTGENASRIIDL